MVSRQVFSHRRGHTSIDLPRVSGTFQLACGELEISNFGPVSSDAYLRHLCNSRHKDELLADVQSAGWAAGQGPRLLRPSAGTQFTCFAGKKVQILMLRIFRGQSQYIDAGQRTLNIATNGGLTIVAVVRFTGAIGNWERIIDLASHIVIYRKGVTSELGLVFQHSPPLFLERTIGSIEQGSWVIVVVRYNAATKTVTYNSQAEVLSTAATDKTVDNTFIGKSMVPDDAYLNGDIAGVFVVDEYVSDAAVSGTQFPCCTGAKVHILTQMALLAVTAAISEGTYTTAILSIGPITEAEASVACTCNAGYTGGSPVLTSGNSGVERVPCEACKVGQYKSSSGSSACSPCPVASSSPAASVNRTSCTCNAGFVGPDGGGSCTVCRGAYKLSSGSAACIDCAAGKYPVALVIP